MTKQAFIRGFYKRAQQQGASEAEIMAALQQPEVAQQLGGLPDEAELAQQAAVPELDEAQAAQIIEVLADALAQEEAGAKVASEKVACDTSEYAEGFLKRAAEYGYSIDESVKLYKQATEYIKYQN